MAQQIINVSTPNDGLGDTLRNSQIKANDNFTELYEGKVDKEPGKGLSSNDYVDADQLKLEGIEEFAQKNVQADWLQEDNTADDYIKNKPNSPTTVGGFSLFVKSPSNTDALNINTIEPYDICKAFVSTGANLGSFGFFQYNGGDNQDITSYTEVITSSLNTNS